MSSMKPKSAAQRAVERWIRYPTMIAFNWLQGCRFFWVSTPGSPAGGYLDMTERCCPYPLRFDWSVRACVKAGDCGCIKGIEYRARKLAQDRRG